MKNKIIDIDAEFDELKDGFFNEASINRRTANKNKGSTLEFKQTMSKIKTGKKRLDMVGDNNPAKSLEERQRRRERFTGVKKTAEQIKNWKQANKNLPILICPHCKIESQNRGNMNRYHFDNCKHKK